MERKVRRCRVCGCTDDDCRQCVEKTGHPCRWVEEDLCSACAGEMRVELNLDGGMVSSMTIKTEADIREAGEFIGLVRRMRKAQKDFFQFRDGMRKAHARRLEQEVDEQLESWGSVRTWEEAREQHPELFPVQ